MIDGRGLEVINPAASCTRVHAHQNRPFPSVNTTVVLGINGGAGINYPECIQMQSFNYVGVSADTCLLRVQTHQERFHTEETQPKRSGLRRQAAQLFTQLRRPPSNEDRSGAPGPRRGNLAGRRLLGSSAEALPALC